MTSSPGSTRRISVDPGQPVRRAANNAIPRSGFDPCALLCLSVTVQPQQCNQLSHLSSVSRGWRTRPPAWRTNRITLLLASPYCRPSSKAVAPARYSATMRSIVSARSHLLTGRSRRWSTRRDGTVGGPSVMWVSKVAFNFNPLRPTTVRSCQRTFR